MSQHRHNSGDLHIESQPLSVLRTEVVERLKLNYAYDNINDHELSLRIEQAEAGRTHAELRAVVADLPLFHEPGETGPSGETRRSTTTKPAKEGSPVELNSGKVSKSSIIFALLGGAERRGVWRPARSTKVVALMGGVDLDYRKAVFPPGRTVVNALCVMGGLDIVVPPGVTVEVSALPILGGVDDRSDSPEDPSAPVLEIRAIAIMGGVDIKTRKSKTKTDTQ